MTDAEAEAQAFIDFRETAEESQQSSRPDRISMQQAGLDDCCDSSAVSLKSINA